MALGAEEPVQIETVLDVARFTAAALVLVAFWLYNRSGAEISTGTWLILLVGDGLDASSYWIMTHEELAKNVIPLCFAGGTVCTFVYAVIRGRFSFPKAPDIFVMFLDAIITVMWLGHVVFDIDATAANLLYQATAVLAFAPTYRSLATEEFKEVLWPWVLWTAAFVVFFFSASFAGGKAEEAVYPLVGLATHAFVIAFVLEKGAAQRQ